jgi:NADPH:quinone reductase-like Zn-dependent oxidoreductase
MSTIEDIIRRQLDVRPERLEPVPGRPTMQAVVTTGNGGLDRLVYRDVARPSAGPGEVLVRVLAAGVNNTEINTRLGWYSSSVTTDTGSTWQAEEQEARQKADGGWSLPTPFPFIQGTDCCGRVVELGDGVDSALLGARIIVRPNMRPDGFGSLRNVWMASEFDGAFAQFVKVPASEVFPVASDWADVELGSIPCAYGTAENMIHRARVGQGDHVVVTGASGGVGSAAVQLARRRGARVTALAGLDKAAEVQALGADRVLDRDADVLEELGPQSVDVVIDNVTGPGFGALVEVLGVGGRYASSGAIAGPMVTFDKRSFYLRDITLIGCTAWDEPVFPNLVGYIERGEIRPLVAKVFPLAEIAVAQAEFQEKRHVGKLVLVPPPDEGDGA